MTILSTENFDDIRRLHDIWVARLAFEYRCERDDVLAAIQPRQAESSQTAVVSTSELPRSDVKAEEEGAASPSSAYPSPSGASKPDHFALDTADLDPNRFHLANCIWCRARIYEGDDLRLLRGDEFYCSDACVQADPTNQPVTALESPLEAAEAEGESPATQVEAAIASAEAEVEGQPSLISATTDRMVGVNVSGPASQGVTAGETAPSIQESQPARSRREKAAAPSDEAATGKSAGERSPAAPTNRERVRLAHAAHPELTCKDLAELLGMSQDNLRSTAKQAGVSFPSAWKKANADRLKSPARGVAKPQAAISAKPAVRPTTSGLLNQPTADITDIVEERPDVRRPSSTTRFYLRDKIGRYVHQSLDASPTDVGPLMTSKRAYGWIGTRAQLVNAAKKWPVLRDMRREVPAK